MSDAFYRLAPFIQDFIYKKQWETLRGIQVEALGVILDTPNHVLITSGTASGKTEAAFLPILTDILEKPARSIAVLYIGPLKALINDQFERLSELLDETAIPLQSWHGDVSQSKKQKFLKQAQGVLQITPESLEAMLINRHSELPRLFGDLRYVVIDEVHAFINSERGRQILCQLQRLERAQRVPPRRVGLSATIGDPQLTMQWLKGHTPQAVTLIKDTLGKRSVDLGLEAFLLPSEAIEDGDPSQPAPEPTDEEVVMLKHMHGLVQATRKTLIFVNQRGTAEKIITDLRQVATRLGTSNDIYHVHHGSISAPLREAAEDAMREPDKQACTAATVTLELGIDIGQLDQVLQINATHSVASFVQRLGRSGRRGNASRLFFYCPRTEPLANASLGELMPWDLLQTIAIIQLYVEEQWIEPPTIPQLPFSLLYHQTISILASMTELTPPQLAERVLTLAPFKAITQTHYRDLLRYLVQTEHLEQSENGGLIIGLKGERLVNHYHFYATFEDDAGFQVRDKSREIGTIQTVPMEGDTLGLAGFAWRVLEVNLEKRQVHVERIKGRAKTAWSGGDIELHARIVQRVRQILREETVYGYLQTRAQQQLHSARQLAQRTGLNDQTILPLAPRHYLIFPWCGTRTFRTVARLLGEGGVKMSRSFAPFYMEVTTRDMNAEQLQRELHRLARLPISAEEITERLPRAELFRNKYDTFVPDALLREQYGTDYLDMSGAKEVLKGV